MSRLLTYIRKNVCWPCAVGQHFGCLGHCDCCNAYTATALNAQEMTR
jgi:hypothetical protein